MALETLLAEKLAQLRDDYCYGINDLLARFCDVTVATVHGWREGSIPSGAAQFKLIAFLEYAGYDIPGHETVNPVASYMRQLYVLSILPAAEQLSMLGLSKKESYLFRIYRNGILPASLKSGTVTHHDLTERFELKRISALVTIKQEILELKRTNSAPTKPAIDELSEEEQIEIVVAGMLYFAPLLDWIAADDTRADLFREALDTDVFYALLDALKSMTSKSARNKLRPSFTNPSHTPTRR